MAISWSGWDYGNSNAGFRVGHEVTHTTVSHSSSSVTYTIKTYVEAMYNVDDSMTITYGGSISGTSTQNLTCGSSGCYKYWGSKTYTYNYSTYGSSPGTRTFTSSLSGVYNGANPSKSTTVTLPARPYDDPAAPSNVTATRNSDSQNTITWTRNATSGEPYSSLTVQQRKYEVASWSSWSTIATTSGSATSYVDTGNDANAKYQYQVRANNSAGSSSYVQTGELKNTPNAPTNVASVLEPGGTQITTTWSSDAYTDAGVTHTVQRSVAGGAYANVQTGIAQGTNTWTDPSPGVGTNQYRVAAVQSTGSLTSAWAEGNIITTIVAPLAPTLLSPNGGARDATLQIVLSWWHNHGGDHAAQSHYTIEYSTNGGANWSTLANDVASATTMHITTANTWTNGQSVLWRVKTEGVVAAGYGPFSSNATITMSAAPTTNLTAPGATINTAQVTATWTYSQAQSSPQAAWEANLYASDGTTLLEARSGTGTGLTTTFDYVLVDGTTYVVKQRSQSGVGTWSAWDSNTFQMVLMPPAAIDLVAEFQPCTGSMILSLTPQAPEGGVTVTATHAKVERRVNGGEWVTLIESVAVPNDILDVIPVTNGINEYRVTSISASPSYYTNAVVVAPGTATATSDGLWVLLAYGNGFQNVLRFRGDPDLSETTGRVKEAVHFLGRRKPVQLLGANIDRVVAAGGTLFFEDPGSCVVPDLDGCRYDSPPADWAAAGTDADVVCYRDYTGRRIFGMLSEVAVSDGPVLGLGAVSFSVTETSYSETTGTIEAYDAWTEECGPPLFIDGGSPASSQTPVLDGGTP